MNVVSFGLNGNSQQQTAQTLGLSRQGLLNKLKRYKLSSRESAL